MRGVAGAAPSFFLNWLKTLTCWLYSIYSDDFFCCCSKGSLLAFWELLSFCWDEFE